ncbi:MAG: 2-amino-4-hydroxy-6-hydroxymethyldihydropteridine diphosphokinase [Chloroflexia bacterium]
MVKAYLGLGSNMGDPRAQLKAAIAAIGRLPSTDVLRASPLYGSKAWGKTDQPDFLNMALEIETNMPPHTLLKHCKRIEAEQGRVPGEHWGPRPIDIDILLYGGRTVSTASLVVPHPRMWERAFVLRPLADLRPDLRAPNGAPITTYLESADIAAQGVWPAQEQSIQTNELL